MDQPILRPVRAISAETWVLPAWLAIPGFGHLASNAFFIRATHPTLVDTGLAVLRDRFVEELRALVDLADLRWIYLTHVDPDHIGALAPLLVAAPNARVVTTFLGMAKMSLHQPLPPDRVYLLNPGQELDLGDRKLVALRPPTFDAPETTGLFDTETRAFFSSDCFGALLPAPVDTAADSTRADLRDGMIRWATIDAPWLHDIDPDKLDRRLAAVRDLQPDLILSSHLPPARGLTQALLANLAAAPSATPFVGPDQEGLLASAGA